MLRSIENSRICITAENYPLIDISMAADSHLYVWY